MLQRKSILSVNPTCRQAARRFALSIGFVLIVGLTAGCHKAESGARPPAATPTTTMGGAAEPVHTQAIQTRAGDKYEYLSEVLKQLASHPQATCRADVAGPHSLQELLTQARALRMQGKSEDAALVLVGLETRLDGKFKMECLKLG